MRVNELFIINQGHQITDEEMTLKEALNGTLAEIELLA